MHDTYALSTWVYLHILIILFRIVPGFLSRLPRVPLGLTPILGGTLRCHGTWLFALAFGRVPFDINKYQGLTPQGCQVSITRTLGGLTPFCMFERMTCKMWTLVSSAPLLRKTSTLSNFLSFVQISCAGSRIFSLCLLSLVVVHYYIETCRRAYIRTILGTLPSIRGLGRRASGSVRTGVISSCRPSCPIHLF